MKGGLQYGIPEIGLIFSQPITINVFVGTDLNGQTLTAYRSLSKTSDWTTDGIVAPGTCRVSSGICTFQSTKASYYGVVKLASRNHTSSGSSPQVIAQFKAEQQQLVTPVIAPTPEPTTNLTPLNLSRTLRLSMTGDDVKALQTYLNTAGFNCGIVDGKFGPKTKAGVILFQKANGLVPDGIVGLLTKAKLK